MKNVLANRYASDELVRLWSPEHKIVLERQLWIAVMKAQKDQGIDIPDEAIAAYEAHIDEVNLETSTQSPPASASPATT